MLEIEDSIIISNQEVIYYQNANGEQIDFSIESSLQSYNYSSITDKEQNHTLVIDNSQPLYQKTENTRWILTIDLEKIIKNFLFANLKKYRTFEGIKKDMTIYDDVNVAIRNYIDFRVVGGLRTPLKINLSLIHRFNIIQIFFNSNHALTIINLFPKIKSDILFFSLK
jgi:hypothetical protein